MRKCWEEEMSCPDCDTKGHVDLYDFIDACENPELREELLCWNINMFKCEHCGFTASLLQELRYIDRAREIRVYLHPIDFVWADDLIRMMRKHGLVGMNSRFDVRDLVRRILPDLDEETDLVFSMEELLLNINLREKHFDLKNNILRPAFME